MKLAPNSPVDISDSWQYSGEQHWHIGKDDAAAHTWGEWTVTKEPTATTEGVKTRTCSVCYHKETETIPPVKPHEHQFGTEWKNDETNHWHECSCGEKSEFAAHTYEDTVTKAATHTEDGVMTHTCTVCGYSYTTEIPATGHDKDMEWQKDETSHWHKCSCGAELDKAVHTWGEWTVTQEPTATTEGSRVHSCTICGYEESETIPTHEHHFDEVWHSDETSHWHECSCGERSGVAAHTYEDTVTKAATHTEAGVMTHACTVCGYSYTTEIPATGHDKDMEWQKDEMSHWHKCSCGAELDKATHTWGEWTVTKEPTATTEGSRVHSCTVCGYEESETVPAVEPQPATYTLTGTVTSAGEGTVTIKLFTSGSQTPAYTAETTETSYTVKGVKADTYTVEVNKDHHAPRTYEITINDNTTLDVTIRLLGDVTQDGKVDTRDWTGLYKHISDLGPLEGYALECADINGDKEIDTRDWTRLYKHINGLQPLW